MLRRHTAPRHTDAAAVQRPIGSIINRSVAHVSKLMMQKRGAAVRIFHIELIVACMTANL